MVLVSVLSDFKCCFCILILIINVNNFRLIYSNSIFCCVVGMINIKYSVLMGSVIIIFNRKFIVIMWGLGVCIVSDVIIVIIIIVLLLEV